SRKANRTIVSVSVLPRLPTPPEPPQPEASRNGFVREPHGAHHQQCRVQTHRWRLWSPRCLRVNGRCPHRDGREPGAESGPGYRVRSADSGPSGLTLGWACHFRDIMAGKCDGLPIGGAQRGAADIFSSPAAGCTATGCSSGPPPGGGIASSGGRLPARDDLELTVQQLEHCAATGESPWPHESHSCDDVPLKCP